MYTKWSNQITAIVTHYSQVDTAQDTWASKLYRASDLGVYHSIVHLCPSTKQE